MNLTNAIECLKLMKLRGQHELPVIAVVRKDIPAITTLISGVCPLSTGQIVLYRRYKGENEGTVEIPMSQEQIADQEARGSGIITHGTICGVPANYIEEIKGIEALI